MPNLINQSYFNREVLVPGVENPVVYEPLCKFISEFEPEFLQKAMGYAFATEFMAAIAEEEVATKWSDIVNGAEYEMNGVTKKWKGLRDSTLKSSPIARYVYYFYMRDGMTTTSGIGEVSNSAENATRTSPAGKMVKAWNDAVKAVAELRDFLYYKTESEVKVYDTFSLSQVDYCHFQTINTMGL